MLSSFHRVVIASALVAVLGAVPSGARAAFPGVNGRLVFGLGDEYGPLGFVNVVSQPHEALFTASADGGDVRRLTVDTGFDQDPAWSPDGRRIAFASTQYRPDGGAWSGVRVVDAQGELEKTWSCHCGRPSWSADGKKLVVESRQLIGTERASHMQLDLSIADPDGSNLRRLTDDGPADRWPVWSPRGDLIAFESSRGQSLEGSDIYVIRPDGTGLRRLTHAAGTHPTWSPDGHWVAFSGTTRPSERPAQILAVPVEGGSPVTLSRDPERSDLIPVWSPDGTRISYAGAQSFAVEAFVQRIADPLPAPIASAAIRFARHCIRFHRLKPRRLRVRSRALIADWQPRRSRRAAVHFCRPVRDRHSRHRAPNGD
jgi:Tol biopolymer transport system component